MSNEAIIRKILALLDRTEKRGATKHEAEIALRKANELMTEYSITEFDLKKVDRSSFVEKSIKYKRQSSTWIYTHLADAFDCEFFYYSRLKEGVFFGFEIDVKICIHFANMLTDVLESEIKNYKKSRQYYYLVYDYQPQAIIHNFVSGFTEEIESKLKELKDQRNAKIQESTGTALMVIKAEQVQEAFKLKHQPKPSKEREVVFINGAYISGGDSAEAVQFNPAIESEADELLKIGTGKAVQK